MAEALILGVVVSKVSDLIIHVTKKNAQFKPELTQLQETITRIEPLAEALDRSEKKKERFIALMEDAEALILKCKSVKRNVYKKYTLALKLEALNASILKFFQIDVPLEIVTRIQRLEDLLMRMMKGDSDRSFSRVPLLKGNVIGFGDRVRALKGMILNDSAGDECSVVVVSAAGGFGKTTLVTMLCHDPEIIAIFSENIYFATISETPNLQIVVKNLLGKKEAEFVNDDDAINQWGSFLNENDESDILLVLDDVWSDSIINRFKFNHHGYKILATSRTTFTQFNTYQLQLLNQQDATNLFRHAAFSEGGIQQNGIPNDLVNKLVKCCKKHPLALIVIGGLLKGKRIERWHNMWKKLSDRHQSVLDLDDDESIERCLARSLEMLEEESVIKECFLDLGLFLEDQKISATMLMDMWVHLYNDDEDGLDTIDHIFELSDKNLATLLPIRTNSPMITNYCEEKALTQHDLLRTLAIRLSSQEPLETRKRLIINANGQHLPKLPHNVNALLLSISTDERFTFEWNDIEAPKVEVFVLNFMSKLYHLPQFIQTMKNLKVLFLTNYGYNFSNLQNFPSPQSLSSLTTIRLEHVSISSIITSILNLANLKKLSLIMCKIGNSFNEYIHNKKTLTTTLLEIDIDSCDDLNTFPSIFFNLIKLSITNCHELSSLSEEFGNLKNLEVLRLASCTKLENLPESMTNLQKLRAIDLSDCLNLKKLPDLGELSGLRTIHMRYCRGIHELTFSVKDLGQLEVVCDEETSYLWKNFTGVNVHLVEEDRIGTLSKIIQNDMHV